jgi:hypothetical protein
MLLNAIFPYDMLNLLFVLVCGVLILFYSLMFIRGVNSPDLIAGVSHA